MSSNSSIGSQLIKFFTGGISSLLSDTPLDLNQVVPLSLPAIDPEKALPLDFIPLSNEEIAANSLLSHNQTDRSRPKFPPYFFEFSRSFLAGIGGVDVFDSVAGLEWLLQNTAIDPDKKDELTKEIVRLKKLEESLSLIRKNENQKGKNRFTIDTLATDFAHQVRGLQPGECRLMTGHFSRPAKLHLNPRDLQEEVTLVYEFTKNSNGTYTITICCSSLLEYSEIFAQGDKTRLTPFVCYSNVPEKALFFSSPSTTTSSSTTTPAISNDFFKGLLLMSMNRGNKIKEQRIFEVFDFLKIPPTIPRNTYAKVLERLPSPTTKSSSATSSFKVWISKIAGNLENYRKIMFQLKLKLFIAAYYELSDSLKRDDPKEESNRRLLENAARNLLRRAAKMGYSNKTKAPTVMRPTASSSSSHEPESQDPTLQQAVATAYDVLRIIQDHDKKIALARASKTISTNLITLNLENDRKGRRKALCAPDELNADSSRLNLDKSELPNFYTLDLTSENFVENLSTLTRELVSSFKGYTFEVRTIYHLISQLPVPKRSMPATDSRTPSSSSSPDASASSETALAAPEDTFWDRMNDSEVDTMIEALTPIVEVIGVFDDLAIRLTKRHATVLSLQAIMHYLIVRKDRARVAKLSADNPKTPIPSIEDFCACYSGYSINELNLTYLDRKDYDRIQSAHAYFDAFNRSAKIQVDALFYTEYDDKEKNFKMMSYATQTYINRLLAADSALNEEVTRAAEAKWPTLTVQEIEEDYQEECKTRSDWQLANARYQLKRAYERSVADYDRDLRLWKINSSESSENKKPERVPEPEREILDAVHPGTEPPEAQRKQNIPIEERKLNYLRQLDRELLKKYDLDYLYELEKLAFFSRERLHTKYSQLFYPPVYERQSLYSTGWGVSSKSKVTNVIKTGEFADRIQQFYPLQDLGKSFFEIKQTKRASSSRDRELAEIDTLTRKNVNPFLSRLLRAVSESDVSPYQLIYEARQDFEELASEEMQGIFFRLFFRSSITPKNRAKLGVGDLLVNPDDLALFDLCRGFVSQGLEHFKEKPNAVKGGRFFLELAFYVARYLKDGNMIGRAQRISQIATIDNWLKNPNLTPADRAYLHLYRVLFYSLHGNNLSDDQLVEVYRSLVIASSDRSQDAFLTEADVSALEYMRALTVSSFDRLKNNPSLTNRLCNTILESVGVIAQNEASSSNEQSLEWIISPEYPIIQNSKYSINIYTGQIKTPEGILGGQTPQRSWKEDPTFLRVFKGQTNFEYHILSRGVVTFNHPEFEGLFRLTPNGDHYVISRQFPGSSEWYTYYAFMQVDSRNHEVLRDDLTFWALSSHSRHRPVLGYYTSLTSQERKYMLQADGKIVEVDAKTGLQTENSLIVDQLHRAFPQFDKNVLIFQDQNNLIRRLEFPRYASADGNPLVFIANDKNLLVWTENEQYSLPNQIPQGYLGKYSNYLFLQPLDKKLRPKILVPFQMHSMSHNELDVQSRTPPVKVSDAEQKGQYQYFTYNVDELGLKPTSQESQLFLAYVYYCQGNSTQTIALLKDLKKNDKLTPVSRKILGMITSHPLPEHPTPDQKMVILHAQLVEIKDNNSKSNEVIQNHFPIPECKDPEELIEKTKEVTNRFASCLHALNALFQSRNNISVDCRPSLEDEELLMYAFYLSLCDNPSLMNSYVPEYNDPEWKQHLHDKFTNRSAPLHGTKSNNHLTSISSGGRPQNSKVPQKITEGWVFAFAKPPKENSNAAEASYRATLQAQIKTIRAEASRRIDLTKHPIESLEKPPYYNSEKFTLSVLEAAKTGTEAARTALLFWIRLWRLQLADNEENARKQLDTLIMILRSPRRFPDYIDITQKKYTDEEVHKFLLAYEAAVRSSISENENYFNPPQGVQSEEKRRATKVGDYPIEGASLFDLKKEELLQERTPSDTIDIALPLAESRWNQLKKWKANYLIKVPAPKVNAQPAVYQFEENMLPEGADDFKEPLILSLEEAQKEHDKGANINRNVKKFAISQSNCRLLENEVDHLIAATEKELQQAEEKLIHDINKEPQDPDRRTIEQAKLGGKVQKRLTFDDCLYAMLSLDTREYTRLNENLKDYREISTLAHETAAIVDMKSKLAQLKRIHEIATKLQSNAIAPLERAQMVQKLEEELSSRYTFDEFDEETQLVLRTFSGQTGKIPYAQQTRLLKMMMELEKTDGARFKDIVIQLIMGGGKTSVLATILMYLSAKRMGRSSLFIVPGALFNVVKNNLGASLKEAFGVNLEQIDLEREDMTIHRLNQVENILQESQKKCIPLITKATTIQSFNLEFFSQAILFKDSYKELSTYDSRVKALEAQITEHENNLYQAQGHVEKASATRLLKNSEAALKKLYETTDVARRNLASSRQKLIVLEKILRHLRQNTDAILDEVDQLLCALLEVNFPIGDKIPVSREGNSLLLSIFKGLLSKDVMIKPLKEDEKPVSIDEFVNLTKKDRAIISETDYLTRVVPPLAEYLASNCDQLTPYINGHREGFIRFISGVTPVFIRRFIDMDPADLTEEFLDSQGVDWKAHSIATLQKDLQFRRHRRDLYETGNKDEATAKQERLAAQTISLARGTLLELLRTTLKHSGNREYGIKDDETGEIVPYLGVNTPATTEFGYHWIQACYFYQWAAAFPPSARQIFKIAKEWKDSAKHSVQTHGITYEETEEYKHFFNLFGVSLELIHEPGNVEKAIAHLRGDVNQCMDLQFENVAKSVSYYPKRLCSNGANFMSQLSSRRGMSGTPWNVEGFLESMLERFFPDVGTEGRIFDAFTNKTTEKKIITVSLNSVTDFLETSFAQIPENEHHLVNGITDAGAFFKKFPENEKIAEEIMGYLSTKETHKHIKGVLFFRHNKDTGEDILYVWKKGAEHPEEIGGSSLEALRAHNLSPEDYFTYYAERNTTGTDITQILNGITLFTFDEELCTRNTTQALMRYRQYLSTHNAYVAMTAKSAEYIYNQGKTALDLLTHGIIVQTLKKSYHMNVHFGHMISNIPMNIANDKLQSMVQLLSDLSSQASSSFSAVMSEFYDRGSPFDAQLADEIERYEDIFVQPMVDDPYMQYDLKEKVETKKSLKTDLRLQAEKVGSLLSDNDTGTKAELDAMVASMETHIDNARSLPLYREEHPFPLDMQIENQSLIRVEAKTLVEPEIDNNIELNTQDFRSGKNSIKRRERKMPLPAFVGMLEVLQSYGQTTQAQNVTDAELEAKLAKLPPADAKRIIDNAVKEIVEKFAKLSNEGLWSISTLQHQLSKYPYGTAQNPFPFQKAFKEPIFGTNAYFNSCDETLSVFEDKQRPSKQILAFRMPDQSFCWLLLSERECRYAIKHLKTLYSQKSPLVAGGVWLIQPDGTPFISHGSMEPFPSLEDEAVLDDDEILANPVAAGLLEINALDGNVEYFHKHPVSAEHWLKSDTDLKLAFVQLKAESDDRKFQIYKNSPIIAMKDRSAALGPKNGIHQARLKGEQQRQGTYEPDSPAETKTISQLYHIRLLKCEYVKYLGIDLDMIDEDTHNALKMINENLPAQYRGNEAVFRERIQELHKIQFSNLRSYHGPYLTRKQVEKWLPAEQVKILTDKSQICEFDENGKIIRYLLTHEQLFGENGGLVEKQAHLIPYIHPDFYGELTKGWEIANVPVDQLHRINPRYYDLISDEQLEKITDPRFLHTLIEEGLDPTKFSLIHGNLCHLLPDEYKKDITPAQIDKINISAGIKYLPELEEEAGVAPGTFSRHINPIMVKGISEEQIPYMTTPSQIREIWNEGVYLLDTEKQVPHIKKSQVPALTNEQLAGCPNKLVQYIDPTRISELPNEKLPFLKNAVQIVKITTPERFACLSGVASGDVANQMAWINPTQYGWVTDQQVPGLNKDQLLAISKEDPEVWNRIKNLMTKIQIQTFDSKKLINLLSNDQIEQHLKADQVKLLTKPTQILSCPIGLLNSMTPEQIEMLTVPEKIQALRKKSHIETLCTINNNIVTMLMPSQAAHVPNELLHLISEEQIPGLTKQQIYYISNELPEKWPSVRLKITKPQAETFLAAEYFDLLLPEQITAFATLQQVPLMKTPEQIQSCPDHLVKNLDAEIQIPHIKTSQVPFVEGKKQLSNIPAGVEFIDSITPAQYPTLPKTLKNQLTPQQVGRFDQEFVDRVVGFSLQYLRGHHEYLANPTSAVNLVKHMKEKHLTHFEASDVDGILIKKLTMPQVEKVEENNANVIARLSPEQIPFLRDVALREIPVANIPELKAVAQHKVHLLTVEQVIARDLSGMLPHVAYRIVGLARSFFIPVQFVAQLVVDVVLTVYLAIKCRKDPTEENYNAMMGRIWKLFISNPVNVFMSPIQVYRPEKYWMMQSRRAAELAS